MFKKPIKIKSSSSLRTSEKKQIIDHFMNCYPRLKDDDIKEIFPKKESIAVLKVETSSEAVVEVYLVQRRAIAFKVDSVVFPTVYTLWKFPDMLNSFTTHSLVLTKLKEGADLMIPGVIFPEGSNFNMYYGTFEKNSPASINTTENRAPIAVGVTACNSGDMFISTKGKCVIVYHVIGDKLCTLENLPTLPIPQLQPPEFILNTSNNNEKNIISEKEDKIGDINLNDENCESSEKEVLESSHSNDGNDMDHLLRNCFFSCIKFSKNIELPVLTSTFYKTYVVPYCPKNTNIDLKKSSFKKLSNFLKEMVELGIITLQEKKTGVHEIIEINHEHPIILSFREGNKIEKNKEEEKELLVQESVTVNASVLPIFKEFNLTKGSILQKSEVRNYIKQYVQLHNLQDENDPKRVKVNDAFNSLFKESSSVTWEELFQKLFSSMGYCVKIQNNETEVLQKGKLELISLTVVTRTGNKKVTIVDNLETYGINIQNFGKECQQGAAASVSINTVKGKKSRQLLVQGNQVNFIASLLQNNYKIPKKYISGMENAPKKKK